MKIFLWNEILVVDEAELRMLSVQLGGSLLVGHNEYMVYPRHLFFHTAQGIDQLIVGLPPFREGK